MEGTTEFDAPFKYFSHIRMTEGHWSRTICKGSGLQSEEFSRQRDSNPSPLCEGKSVFTDFSNLFSSVHKYVSSSKY